MRFLRHRVWFLFTQDDAVMRLFRKLVRYLYSWLLHLKGAKPGVCYGCGKHVAAFLPFKGGQSKLPIVCAQAGIIGSDTDRFMCPSCGATDRERHLLMYFHVTGMPSLFGARVLHFAPEPVLSSAIRQAMPSIYIQADLYPKFERILKIDITKIPFKSGIFDIVIANHVLEHVSDDTAGLLELRRVMRAGGYAILQTPYSSKYYQTSEDENIQSCHDRLLAYGQEDHVRLYGQDIFSRIELAGFRSIPVRHDALLNLFDPHLYGVNPEEPFMLFIASHK